jgi:hypothetical protein
MVKLLEACLTDGTIMGAWRLGLVEGMVVTGSIGSCVASSHGESVVETAWNSILGLAAGVSCSLASITTDELGPKNGEDKNMNTTPFIHHSASTNMVYSRTAVLSGCAFLSSRLKNSELGVVCIFLL